MHPALLESHLKSLPLLARGKVRDNYAVGGDRILMVASDRLSAFDVVLPDPIPGAALVTAGPYGRCRHPLYQAVLLCSLGVTLALGSLLHLALLLGLAAVLGGKARREERALAVVHPDYAAYRAVTPAIIPRSPWLDWREL